MDLNHARLPIPPSGHIREYANVLLRRSCLKACIAWIVLATQALLLQHAFTTTNYISDAFEILAKPQEKRIIHYFIYKGSILDQTI